MRVENLFIVSHANDKGTLTFPLEDGDRKPVSFGSLEVALEKKANLFKLSGQIDKETTIHIKGCRIGQSKDTLNLLDKAFGSGQGTVTAPTQKQQYEFEQLPGRRGTTASESFFQYRIESPGRETDLDVPLPREQQLERFKKEYRALNLTNKTWEGLLPEKGAKRLEHEKSVHHTIPISGKDSLSSDETLKALAEESFLKDIKKHPELKLPPDVRPNFDWVVDQRKSAIFLERSVYLIDTTIVDETGNPTHPEEPTKKTESSTNDREKEKGRLLFGVSDFGAIKP